MLSWMFSIGEKRGEKQGAYHVDDEIANTDHDGTNDGCDPVDLVLGGPPVDEEAHGKYEGAEHEGREAVLGLHAFGCPALCLCRHGLFRGLLFDGPVAGEGEEGDAEHAANADS